MSAALPFAPHPPFGLSHPPFGLSLSKPLHPPFGLSLSKPRVNGPFDKLRVNGKGCPFGLSLSKPPRRAA
jgi:hypothetical protein